MNRGVRGGARTQWIGTETAVCSDIGRRWARRKQGGTRLGGAFLFTVDLHIVVTGDFLLVTGDFLLTLSDTLEWHRDVMQVHPDIDGPHQGPHGGAHWGSH